MWRNYYCHSAEHSPPPIPNDSGPKKWVTKLRTGDLGNTVRNLNKICIIAILLVTFYSCCTFLLISFLLITPCLFLLHYVIKPLFRCHLRGYECWDM